MNSYLRDGRNNQRVSVDMGSRQIRTESDAM